MTNHRVKWTANLAIWMDFGWWPTVIFIPGARGGGRQDCMAYTIHPYTEGQNPNAGQMLAIQQNSHDNNN